MPSSSTKYLLQRVKNIFWHLPKSIYYQLVNGLPTRHLTLIGITGTDGKTSTATLVHQILLASEIKSDLITTVNSPGLHTTSPDPRHLLPIFSQMIKKGVTHVVVEATAHGIDQHRFFGCHFAVSALTNITHEHFDDFVDINHYQTAKLQLFRNSSVCILNADDSSYTQFQKKLSPGHQTISYGISPKSQLRATNITVTRDSLSFDADGHHFVSDSPYRYQVYNILAAYGICQALGVNHKVFLKTIRHFPEVAGRRQLIENDLGITAIVDFAHTPHALVETLSSLYQPRNNHQTIVIFGATGGRDQSKRPLMGQAVSQHSDIAILTSDDTRQEDIDHINQQIISGIDQTKIKKEQFKYYVQSDRQKAFDLALSLARKGDTVIACGKGHETSILIGKTEYPWSDAQAFRTSFRNTK